MNRRVCTVTGIVIALVIAGFSWSVHRAYYAENFAICFAVWIACSCATGILATSIIVTVAGRPRVSRSEMHRWMIVATTSATFLLLFYWFWLTLILVPWTTTLFSPEQNERTHAWVTTLLAALGAFFPWVGGSILHQKRFPSLPHVEKSSNIPPCL